MILQVIVLLLSKWEWDSFPKSWQLVFSSPPLHFQFPYRSPAHHNTCQRSSQDIPGIRWVESRERPGVVHVQIHTISAGTADSCVAPTLKDSGIRIFLHRGDVLEGRHAKSPFAGTANSTLPLIFCHHISHSSIEAKSFIQLSSWGEETGMGCRQCLDVNWNPEHMSEITPGPIHRLSKPGPYCWSPAK